MPRVADLADDLVLIVVNQDGAVAIAALIELRLGFFQCHYRIQHGGGFGYGGIILDRYHHRFDLNGFHD
jgi:hypothetical protein